MRNKTKKGSLYSFLVAIALMCLLIVSMVVIKPISFIISGLLVIDICVFIFNFTPYLAYDSRIKQIQKDGKYKEEKNKTTWKLFVLVGVLLLAEGIFYIVLSINSFLSSSKYYKKYKKSL